MVRNRQEESVCGIVFSPNREKVLLIKRRDVPVWVLPGGGLEEGESPETATVREVEEETGFKVSVARKVAEYTPLCRLALFTHFFECEITSGEAMLGAETQGVRFFSLSELPLMPPPYANWIADAAKGTPIIKKHIDNVTYLNLLKQMLLHPILVCRFLLARLGFPLNDK